MQEKLRRMRDERAEGDRGFTLIELLVVVVIIGVLIAIAIPLYLNYRKGAENKSAASDVRGAISAAEQYYTENGQRLPGNRHRHGEHGSRLRRADQRHRGDGDRVVRQHALVQEQHHHLRHLWSEQRRRCHLLVQQRERWLGPEGVDPDVPRGLHHRWRLIQPRKCGGREKSRPPHRRSFKTSPANACRS